MQVNEIVGQVQQGVQPSDMHRAPDTMHATRGPRQQAVSAGKIRDGFLRPPADDVQRATANPQRYGSGF